MTPRVYWYDWTVGALAGAALAELFSVHGGWVGFGTDAVVIIGVSIVVKLTTDIFDKPQRNQDRLCGGYIRKGGTNGESQIQTRPPAPDPMKTRGKQQ